MVLQERRPVYFHAVELNPIAPRRRSGLSSSFRVGQSTQDMVSRCKSLRRDCVCQLALKKDRPDTRPDATRTRHLHISAASTLGAQNANCHLPRCSEKNKKYQIVRSLSLPCKHTKNTHTTRYERMKAIMRRTTRRRLPCTSPTLQLISRRLRQQPEKARAGWGIKAATKTATAATMGATVGATKGATMGATKGAITRIAVK